MSRFVCLAVFALLAAPALYAQDAAPFTAELVSCAKI